MSCGADALGITALGLQVAGCAAFIELGGGGIGPAEPEPLLGPDPFPDLEPVPGSTEISFCGQCFAAGTPVHTQRGNVPVEAIHVGDKVYALDAQTGKTELRPVTALIPKHIGRLVELRVAGEPAVLRASVAHPFWVKRTSDETPHWINAANLKPGELAETIDGNWAEIQSVTPQPNEEIVYNFTVAKDHDYFVGETGFLVHNAGNCDCFPHNPLDMNDILGFEGTPKADGPLTPGRNKWFWDLGNMLITFEQHPYDVGAPDWHRGPHWHVDWPGRRHARFCPGEKFPGLP